MKRKLHQISIYIQLRLCDPDSVIPVPERIKTFHSFGLDFKLPVWKLNFFHY